ncbi:MAG: SIR2 family NAD-dependent protein deacylase [Acidimicrobiia bacterium]
MEQEVDSTELETIASWIRASGRVVVLTGAGISTESGIPDFRGPQGIWTKNPEAERKSDISFWINDPEVRISAWKRRLQQPSRDYEPNAGHLALVELEKKGKLHTLVTQNIDRLHHKAGTSPEIIIEMHGNTREVMCLDCSERAPVERLLARVEAGEEDPHCRTCGGILKTATISFGQNLIAEDIERSELATASCDIFMALGTLLTVTPVAYLPGIALRAGAKLVIVNADETAYDNVAHAVIYGKTGEVLPKLVELV